MERKTIKISDMFMIIGGCKEYTGPYKQIKIYRITQILNKKNTSNTYLYMHLLVIFFLRKKYLLLIS